jgi:hypothetical protein
MWHRGCSGRKKVGLTSFSYTINAFWCAILRSASHTSLAGEDLPILLQQALKSLSQASATIIRGLLDPVLAGKQGILPSPLFPTHPYHINWSKSLSKPYTIRAIRRFPGQLRSHHPTVPRFSHRRRKRHRALEAKRGLRRSSRIDTSCLDSMSRRTITPAVGVDRQAEISLRGSLSDRGRYPTGIGKLPFIGPMEGIEELIRRLLGWSGQLSASANLLC